MTNYFDNLVFITRNTSIAPSEINSWPYFDFEMYMKSLKEKLDKENDEAKKRQAEIAKQTGKNNMDAQMRAYMSKLKK